MPDIRKNLIILVFVLSGVVITLLIFNFGKTNQNKKAGIVNTRSNILENLPLKLSKATVSSFEFKNKLSKVTFYEEIDSIIYEVDLDGKNKKEIARLPDASVVNFSPSSKEIIATIYERGILRKNYFDLEDNKKVQLDKDIKKSAFSPDGLKIVSYSYNDSLKQGSISVSRPDGSEPIIILKIRMKDLEIFWPGIDMIVFYSTNQNGLLEAFSLKPNGKELKKLAKEEIDFYLSRGDAKVLQGLGIEAIVAKVSPLGDFLIFVNKKDKKLYSLRP